VTLGPGATNAAHGVDIAEHDSAPMILFIGQVERAMLGRGAFQRWTIGPYSVPQPNGSPRLRLRSKFRGHLSRVSHRRAGRPGPVVVITLPEDMLVETAEVVDAPRMDATPIWPGLTQMAKLRKILREAKRPIAILGGTRLD
jgi:acetolactate synthase I/II/III large subunit